MERRKQIEQRAYALWEADGRPADRADIHWQQAEAEVESDVIEAEDANTLQISQNDSGSLDPNLLAAASPATTAVPDPRRKKSQAN